MTQQPFVFCLQSRQDRARAGSLLTPHGEIQTPVFAPVGTQATVKAVTPAQLQELGVGLILANTYHLFLRPGEALIAEMGGLHKFMGWPGPILTDSGGFQIFSLAEKRQIDSDGVTFKSHIDGSAMRLTPETAVQIQEDLGADIIMAFDECSPPHDRPYAEQAMLRTHAWAERCLRAKSRSDQALFGILQGGIFPDLRQRSAEFISALDFPGIAIGGLSVGESKSEMHAVLELVDGLIPAEKPRYLMGVGTPGDLINGVLRGVDIFDCVLPTRLARHNAAMLRTGGRLNLVNATFANDLSPIEASCHCYTCLNFSRAYLRHLILAREMLAATLISIHNLNILVDLAKEIRQAILDQRLDAFVADYFKRQNANLEGQPEMASLNSGFRD